MDITTMVMTDGAFKYACENGDDGVHRGGKRSYYTANRQKSPTSGGREDGVVLQSTFFTGRFELTISVLSQ